MVVLLNLGLDLDAQQNEDSNMALFSSLLGKVKAFLEEDEVWHAPIESPEDILKFINEGMQLPTLRFVRMERFGR